MSVARMRDRVLERHIERRLRVPPLLGAVGAPAGAAPGGSAEQTHR